MELFGIVLSVPAAFIASIGYCFVPAKMVIWFDKVSRCLWWTSAGLLMAFVIELILLSTVGPVRARQLIGATFYPAHLLLFFLGTPALANVLILRKKSAFLRRWYAAVPLCTVLALALVLLQYGVSEALYGINGDDGPFSGQIT